MKIALAFVLFFFACSAGCYGQQFVKVKNGRFLYGGRPYYYIGTNYWYGGLLGLQKNKAKGIARLRSELDFLQSKGVQNLRVMAGAEGLGLIHGIERVGPPVQPQNGRFNPEVLKGLDILLDEMAKRNMKAIIFFSNNWEWSGGFLQYLQWNGKIEDSVLRRKLSWDEMRDYISRFYTCEPCKAGYLGQVEFILGRTNQVNGKKYVQDPVIMAWELANEPRPMRAASNEAYQKWVSDVAAFIKKKDKNHLLTTGHEGEIGTESLDLFREVHKDKNVDYLTIHIWPRNWGWYNREKLDQEFPAVILKTQHYIQKHVAVAKALKKPLVIEEFGFTRDQTSFDPGSSTNFRNRYYEAVFSAMVDEAKKGGVIGGANFWSFNGSARPVKGQVFWKKGDDYMGDPPMEEQGLYGVFDSDRETWKLISSYVKLLKKHTSNIR